jgi:hypothetical protein
MAENARRFEGKVAFITGAVRHVTGVQLPVAVGTLLR